MFGFIKEFIKNPRIVGAVAPSGKRLAEKMIEDVDFRNCRCIVEYGPGTRVFTEKIIARKCEDTLFLVLEKNKAFCDDLDVKYGHKKNIKIINDGAENIKMYLEIYEINKVDYVVSGLPFASLPKMISHMILDNTKNILKPDGKFITFQYSLVKKEFMRTYFQSISTKRVMINFPPAYVLKCN